uniref:Uncharacterized protein n=1 Tax=Octopus bimaculoides TaxID=37653 RepID=A0A0L8I7V9_OCTBM
MPKKENSSKQQQIRNNTRPLRCTQGRRLSLLPPPPLLLIFTASPVATSEKLNHLILCVIGTRSDPVKQGKEDPIDVGSPHRVAYPSRIHELLACS